MLIVVFVLFGNFVEVMVVVVLLVIVVVVLVVRTRMSVSLVTYTATIVKFSGRNHHPHHFVIPRCPSARRQPKFRMKTCKLTDRKTDIYVINRIDEDN